MTELWGIAPNPSFAGRTPAPLGASECHDGSPFITLRCPDCGEDLHLHESQLADLPGEVNLGVRCAACRLVQAIPIGLVREGFSEMRAQGWIE